MFWFARGPSGSHHLGCAVPRFSLLGQVPIWQDESQIFPRVTLHDAMMNEPPSEVRCLILGSLIANNNELVLHLPCIIPSFTAMISASILADNVDCLSGFGLVASGHSC